jgi:hypothetical protein
MLKRGNFSTLRKCVCLTKIEVLSTRHCAHCGRGKVAEAHAQVRQGIGFPYASWGKNSPEASFQRSPGVWHMSYASEI